MSLYAGLVSSRWVRVAVLAVAAISAGPLAWSVLVRLYPHDHHSGADYELTPPDLSDEQRWAIALVSLLLFSGSVVLAWRGIRRGVLSWEWVGVAAPFAGIALYAAVWFHVATAPVIGANIGAGLVTLAGIVIVPVLLGYFVWFLREVVTYGK